MRKFKVRLLLIIFLLTICLIPYIINFILEKEYYKFIKSLNGNIKNIYITGTFNRGYLNSFAKTYIKIGKNINLELDHHIKNKIFKLALVDTKIKGLTIRLISEFNYNGSGETNVEIKDTLVYEIIAKVIKRNITLEEQNFYLQYEGKEMPRPKLTLLQINQKIEREVLKNINKLINDKIFIKKTNWFLTKISLKDNIIKINGVEKKLKDLKDYLQT